ncbi:MAG TPA: AbrB/MazE/SpoVT family DNA-binding domain-containing protein [Terriglobales bacterium]|nr:AbrB/MazE/SpoVT family DNA-binding domain-containing protein [Terriglobales bacterium]
MPSTRMVRWGRSLAVRIPKSVAEKACIEEGDMVVIEAAKGHVEVHRAKRMPALKELIAQITPENCHEEIEWGPAVGKEIEW